MYRDYLSLNGTTIVSDEKGMHKKETHNKVREELELENEIEIIEINIACLNQEKGKLNTIDNNKKLINKCYGLTIAIFIGIIALVKLCFPLINPTIELPKKILPFIRTNNDFTFYGTMLTAMLFTIPLYTFIPKEAKAKIERIQIIEEQLEFLNSELSQKKTELEELRKYSKKVNVTDTTIHSIDNSKYKTILEERLALLNYIKKYRNKLKTYLANGTLNEELRKLEIKAENISFAEETLKRVLEKEKVTQHE